MSYARTRPLPRVSAWLHCALLYALATENIIALEDTILTTLTWAELGISTRAAHVSILHEGDASTITRPADASADAPATDTTRNLAPATALWLAQGLENPQPLSAGDGPLPPGTWLVPPGAEALGSTAHGLAAATLVATARLPGVTGGNPRLPFEVLGDAGTAVGGRHESRFVSGAAWRAAALAATEGGTPAAPERVTRGLMLLAEGHSTDTPEARAKKKDTHKKKAAVVSLSLIEKVCTMPKPNGVSFHVFAQYRAYFVIGYFGGLRSKELHELTHGNVTAKDDFGCGSSIRG